MPEDRVEAFLRRVRIFWIRVDEGSRLADHTIGEREIRQRTGATIIGLCRDEQVIGAPEPDTTVRAGDVLMVIGNPDAVQRLEALCRGTKG